MNLCKKCNQLKPPTDFYSSAKHECKECIKSRVRKNRSENIDRYRQFDRNRANLPHRVKARSDYQKTDAFKESHKIANIRYVANNQIRKKATSIVRSLIKSGKLQRKPCLVCGNTSAEGHHFDYSMPDKVVWLCDGHHKAAHKIDKEIQRLIN